MMKEETREGMIKFAIVVGAAAVILLTLGFSEKAHPQFAGVGAFDSLDKVKDLVSDSLSTAQLDSVQLKAGGIAGTDLRIDVVDSTKIRDATVSNADLRNDAVTGAKIQAGAVDSTDVTDGNLSGSDLANGTVSKVKIQTSSVDSTKVSDGELSGSDLADGTVSLAKIQSAAVDSTKIVDGSVSNTDLRGDAVTGTKIQASAIDSTDVKDGSIAGGDIATGGITGTQIQIDAVDSTKVGDGKISGTDLASGTVSNAKLMADAVDSTKTKDGALSVSDIANGDNGFVTKPSLDDSLLNYGVRPRLNAKTVFNLKGFVDGSDSLLVLRSSNNNTVAVIDSAGKMGLKGAAPSEALVAAGGIVASGDLTYTFVPTGMYMYISGGIGYLAGLSAGGSAYPVNTSGLTYTFQTGSTSTTRLYINALGKAIWGGSTSPTTNFTIKGVAANGDTIFDLRSSSGNIVVAADSTGQVTFAGAVSTTIGVVDSVEATTTLPASSGALLVIGKGAAGATVTTTPSITAGRSGQELTIIGKDNTQTVTLNDEGTTAGSTLELAGGAAIVLGQYDTITLIYSTALAKWVEKCRSNN